MSSFHGTRFRSRTLSLIVTNTRPVEVAAGWSRGAALSVMVTVLMLVSTAVAASILWFFAY